MKVSNWGDDDGLIVQGLWSELDEFEWATVVLPSGHRVDVFHDEIRIAEPNAPRTKDGKKIWHV